MFHNILLIILIILFSYIIYLFFKVRNKIKNLSQEIWGTKSLIEGIRKQELETASTPKSIMGMEKLDLPKLNKDFKELNINELKRDSEMKIVNCLNAIETKNTDNLKEDILNVWVSSKLEDLKDNVVSYDNIKFHNTILNRYEKNNAVATIKIQTALEYIYKKNNKSPRKIQTRFELEYIYIIDSTKLGSYQNILGINCPNCGAPIKSLSQESCDHCKTGLVIYIKDITKKAWILNNIKEF